MKRILIVGSPGSGKSTLARALQEIINIPLHHIDMLYHKEDRSVVSDETLDNKLKEIMKDSEWIMDGNYSRTMDMRMQHSDTIIFLDFTVDVCLAGVRSRMGKKRPDMPWIEIEEDPEFTQFIKDFPNRTRPYIFELLERYSDKKIFIFEDRSEVKEFIENLRDRNDHYN